MTISLCMIVKNEETVLERCLECMKDIADEMIIVDTGSSDTTKDIARRYTDRVFDFLWNDDFSAARNFAFSMASMDYIYSADADEVIDEENIAKFKALKQALLPEIDIVQMLYTNQLQYNTTYNFDSELRPKLYKRQRDFIWEGELHEAVRLEPQIFDSDIRIIHMPVSSHSGRDFSMYQKVIKKHGMLSEHLHSMYARELAISGKDSDYSEAFDYFSEMAEKDTDEEMLRTDLAITVRCCRLAGNSEEMFRYALRGLALKPSAELVYELGEYYRQKGNMSEAAMWYYNAANETESILNRKVSEEYARKALKETGLRVD